MKKLAKVLLISLFAYLPLFAEDDTKKEEPKDPATEEIIFITADEIDNYDENGNLIQDKTQEVVK
ncbi:MAG: hypothetical protein WCT85_03975 [Parachlamydiales bacterium]|jgi:hypothetical protein